MIVDGKQIAKKMRAQMVEEIRRLSKPLTLTHFVGTDDPAIQSFVRIKRKVADELGVTIIEEDVRLASTEELISRISKCESDGIIVQFPLPKTVDSVAARNAIPISKDVDVISDAAMAAFKEGTTSLMPPVAGAIQAILEEHHIDVSDKKVTIVGNGWLVGTPAYYWFRRMVSEEQVQVVTDRTPDISAFTREADIVVMGAGVPGLLTPDMIKEGVIIIDAGTSEEGGKLLGDADPNCAAKCALFTPVPGGVGPITVAMIFENLLILNTKEEG